MNEYLRLFGAIVCVVFFGFCGVGNANASNTAQDCLFNWAERSYPDFLNAPSRPITSKLDKYYYRYYSTTNSFFALSDDGHVYYYAPSAVSVGNGVKLIDLGLIQQWYALAGCPTPIPVQRSSYLNAKNIGIGPQATPAYAQAIAFADFEQRGSVSLVLGTFAPNAPGYDRALTAGKIKMYSRSNDNNPWIDITAKMLDNDTGCITARKAIVADFNGDRKPDVFIACHGIDIFPLPAGTTSGENPRILMSQPDGTYKNIDSGIRCYCHGAAAADFEGNGFADIVATDTDVGHSPFFLKNMRDGSFKKTYVGMPTSVQPFSVPGQVKEYFYQIRAVELIDFENTGKFDLVLLGAQVGSLMDWKPRVFKNPGNNDFSSASSIVLPVDAKFNDSLDIIYANGYIYLLNVDNRTGGEILQKINYSNLDAQTIFTTASLPNGRFPNGSQTTFWMLNYQGNIVGLKSEEFFSVPQ